MVNDAKVVFLLHSQGMILTNSLNLSNVSFLILFIIYLTGSLNSQLSILILFFISCYLTASSTVKERCNFTILWPREGTGGEGHL